MRPDSRRVLTQLRAALDGDEGPLDYAYDATRCQEPVEVTGGANDAHELLRKVCLLHAVREDLAAQALDAKAVPS